MERFSPNLRDIFERYAFAAQLDTLKENDLLYLVLQKFAAVDLANASRTARAVRSASV